MSEEFKEFSKVCKVSDLKEKIGKRFLVENVDVAVYKIDGKIYALSNICPHQHASIIYDGFVEDGCVICPAHGWEFNLETGKMHNGGKGLDSFKVKIIDDDVFIKVYERKNNYWDF